MKLTLLGLSVTLAAALAACGGTDQNSTNSGGSGGSGASTNTGAGNTGGDSTGGQNTGAGNTGGNNTGGSTGGTNTGGNNTGGNNTGGSAGGGPCGGLAGTPCNPTQFCNYPDDSCGGNDGLGTCEDKPNGCPDVYDPVCACDGMVYGNACEAEAAGVDVSLLGGCAPPDGAFPCGSGFCDSASEFCQVQISDVANEPNTYGCNPLPANCQVPDATCGCLADLPCANMCEQTDGGFTLTCPDG